MTPYEQKRKDVLAKLDASYAQYKKFYEIKGGGIKKKLERLQAGFSPYMKQIFWKLGLFPRHNRNIPLFWGKRIASDLSDLDIMNLYLFGSLSRSFAEHKLTKYFVTTFKEGDVFYDVGANYGFYSYLASEFCKEIHIFEPLPHVFKNVSDNFGSKKAYLNNVALTNNDQGATMYSAHNSGVSTVNADFVQARSDNHKEGYVGTFQVPTSTLDLYSRAHSIPTIIKIDVEGAELVVLEGGEHLLKTASPVVAVEVHIKQEDGNISQHAVEKLRSFGYESYQITDDGSLEKVEGDLALVVAKNPNLTFDNFVFKKPSRI
ncbi:MAG: methyltransferase FkbM family [Patescibacteria group bacterium]|nr:methyltransferase FkbM family [Patescibacteria group bacterium]